jgi:sulfofructose kinase
MTSPERHPEKIQVVGLGQASVDYLGRVPVFPNEDEKVELLDIRMQCGGPASTALVTLARLNVATAFLGSISNDPPGREILRDLDYERVDVGALKMTPGFTSQLAFIAITAGAGKRTIFWHRGSVPPLEPDDVDLSAFPSAALLHLDGLMIEASIEAARQAKTRGMKVVMDAGTMRAGSQRLAALVDVLIASERFATPLVGDEARPETALEALHGLGPELVVITLGPKGSIGSDRRNTILQKAFPVAAVDTTGAGDVYHGGYLYGMLQGWDLHRCMRFASAVSAIKCCHIGGRNGIPDLKTVETFLRNHPNI